MAGPTGTEAMRLSFERIARWMNAHGAPLLVENRGDDSAMADALAVLFAGEPEPKFIAAVRRPSLTGLSLTADRCLEIAVGGALLGNNAVRDLGVGRAKGFTRVGLELLEKRVQGASANEKRGVEAVLQRRKRRRRKRGRGGASPKASDTGPAAKREERAPGKNAEKGNWFTRLFKMGSGRRPRRRIAHEPRR